MSAHGPDRHTARKRAGPKRFSSPPPRPAPESEVPADTASPGVLSADASVLESLGAAISQPLRDAADDSVDRSSSTLGDPPDKWRR
jgi:hypothetical protein